MHFWFCLISLQNYAQSNNLKDQKLKKPDFLTKTDYAIGYYGNMIWNPGLSFSVEYVFKELNKTKEKKRGTKSITNQFLLNGNIGFYWDPKSHSGLLNNYGISWKRINHRGKQISIDINPIGFSRTFLPETYTLINDKIEKVFLPGRFYNAPSFSIGLGKIRQGKKLSARYFKINYTLLTQYNMHPMPMLFIAYGYHFNISK